MKITKTINRLIALTALVVVGMTSTAFANGSTYEPAAEVPSGQNWIDRYNIQPDIKTYINYTFDLKASANQARTTTKYDNAFTVSRFYFGLTGDITNHIGFRFTPEINAKAASGAQDDDFDVFLKYGYVTFKNFDWAPGLSFEVGQFMTPWIGYVENIWGYRLAERVMTDYEGYESSADLGVGLKWEFPSEFGDLHFVAVNGTGFNNGPESDNYKDMQLRVSFTPFEDKSWFFTGGTGVGFTGSTSNRTYRASTILGYKNDDYATVAGEFFYGQDPVANVTVAHPSVPAAGNAKAIGGAFYGELKFYWWGETGTRWSWVLRADYLDPDYSTASNWHYHAITGLGYTHNENFKFLLSYDLSNYSSAALQTGNQFVFLGLEAKL